MSAYYYLVAGLPDISLEDGKLSYTISDFRAESYGDLSAKDQALIDLFYLKYDHADLLSLLKDKDAVTQGKGNFFFGRFASADSFSERRRKAGCKIPVVSV